MFYRPAEGHGLPHNPFNAIVAPRPIGWIATRGPLGDNLAPYSFFNAVAYVPPQVMFSSTTGSRDSVENIRATGVFSVAIVSLRDLAAMNATSAAVAPEIDEFDLAQVEKAPCLTIDCPRVAQAAATLECRMTEIVTLKGRDNTLVIGEVTGVHLRDDCVKNGRFDLTHEGLLARMGYRDYTVVRETFEELRPDDLKPTT